MVHTRYGIGQLRSAEVRRGAIFSEELSSVSSVLKNGGVIGSGAKFVSPQEGFSFNGTADSKITYGDLLRQNLAAITMSCWAKYKTVGDVAYNSIMGQAVGGTYRTEIYTNTGDFYFTASVNGVNRYAQALSSLVTDGNWHQITGTWYSGSYVRLYVDGVLVASSAVTHAGTIVVADAVKDFTIGAWPSGGYPFNGKMRNCMVFNTALDADEIAAYYKETAFQYAPAIQLPMRIEDHDITNVRSLDRSGLMNHAVLGDGSTSTTYPTKRTTGNGYTFDGTTDYMETAQSVSLPSCTFAALVRFDAVTLRTVLSHGTGGDLFVLGTGVQGGTGTNNVLYFSMFSTSWKLAGSGVVPATGVIYSLVGTFDGTTLKLYINGKLDGTNTAATDDRSFPVRVGRRFDAANPNWFDGDIFESCVFDKCLTTTQVLDLDLKMRECLRGC